MITCLAANLATGNRRLVTTILELKIHKQELSMFTIDAHLDLSMNAMEWNRDLRQPVMDIRKRETGLTDKPDRAKGTVALPELRKGNIGLVVATQIRSEEHTSELQSRGLISYAV